MAAILMKTLLTITFTFLAIFCFGQIRENNDALYGLTIAYKPAVISVLADTGVISTSVNNGNISKMTYTSMMPGQYKIQISGHGQLRTIRDSIVVKNGQNLVLNFTFGGPCLYDHPADYIPTCPKKHTDSIISIVYGLVVTRGDSLIKDRKNLKIKYAGCVTTGCDPQFYCKEHDIEF
ncbi:MAG: hypothetical protein HZA79_05790 [Sphingobacteriales bacterium]|nr:hypothetical protein [Sphingobacteriales bacterium]